MTDERSISSSTSSSQQPLTPLSQQSKATVSSSLLAHSNPPLPKMNHNSSKVPVTNTSPRPSKANITTVYQTPTLKGASTTIGVSSESTTSTNHVKTNSSLPAIATASSMETVSHSNTNTNTTNIVTSNSTSSSSRSSSNNNNQNKANNPAVLLGIETLERQQEEFERKRRMNINVMSTTHSKTNTNTTSQVSVERQNPFDDVVQDTPPSSTNLWDPIAVSSTTASSSSNVNLMYNRTSNALGPTPPTLIRSSRGIHHSSQPQDHHHHPSQQQHTIPEDHHIPSTVNSLNINNGGIEIDDEITMESDYPTMTVVNNTVDNTLKKGHLKSSSLGTFANKFFKTPMKPHKRTISDDFRNDPTPQSSANKVPVVQPILFGYLHKLGRNGKWQKRWFESDGTSLFYFKSSSRDQILATLDLLRVGIIQMDYSDSNGCTFTIEVAGRSYYLCADTKERARDWVITLNRVKEARMKVGGLRIVQPAAAIEEGGGRAGMVRRKVNGGVMGRTKNPSSESSRNEDSDSDEDQIISARVITTGSRPRTKGLGKSDFQELEQSLEDESTSAASGQVSLFDNGKVPPSPMAGTASLGSTSPRNTKQSHLLFQNAGIPNVNDMVVVRWRKERSKMQNIVRRLSRWAKRITMIRCVIQNHVVHFDPKKDMYEYHEDLQDRRIKKREEDTSNQMSAAETVRMYSDSYSLEKRNSRPTPRIEQPSLSGSDSGRVSPNIDDDSSGIIA